LDLPRRAFDIVANCACGRTGFNGGGTGSILFFAEQLAARSIEEMQPATGLAVHGFVGAERIVRRGFVRKPVLHIHAGPWTFEDEVTHAARQFDDCTILRLDPYQYDRAFAVQAGFESFTSRMSNKTLQ
jgi:hypothetical protein